MRWLGAALSLLSAIATDGLTLPPLSRRALVGAAAAMSTASRNRGGAPSVTANGPGFSYELKHVQISGATIPVALWKPSNGAHAEIVPASYTYVIDIGKIASRLRVGWLSWLPKFTYNLPLSQEAAPRLPEGLGRARDGDMLVFAHGFLGSCYDMAHAAEALAQDGFVVCAPEMPESLSATYLPPEGLTRDIIIARARELACEECGLPPAGSRWGIFGHSAGAGSAISQGGDFALGRCLLCPGYRGGYRGDDPVFLVASEGDGVTQLMASRGVVLRDILEAEAGVWTRFASPEEAYAVDQRPPPRRGAFIFEDDGQEGTSTAAGSPPHPPRPRPPNHISFLWREVDEAMASLLSPLVPLAKLLGLFLLDFDVYLEARDADTTAARVVPAVRRFFCTFASARR